MKSLAVLLRESGAQLPYTNSRPLEIVEVNLAPPNTREVLVKIESAGICHSDLSVVLMAPGNVHCLLLRVMNRRAL